MDQKDRISLKLKEFLTMPSNGYQKQIDNMVQEKKSTLEINFEKLRDFDMHITSLLLVKPRPILDAMDKIAKAHVLTLYPPYDQATKMRVTNVPLEDIRTIRDDDLGHFFGIVGVVTRLSDVFQNLLEVECTCNKCSLPLGPFLQKLSTTEVVGRSCSRCSSQGPFTVISEKTIYSSRYQKLTLESRHHLVSPATRFPASIEVILFGELIGCTHLGQEIEITGIYSQNYDFPLAVEEEFLDYAKVFEANYVANKQEHLSPYRLNDFVKREVLDMSKDPQIKEKIISCFARGVQGYEYIKTVIALAMFGGQGDRDINVLLLGDGDPNSPMSLLIDCVKDYVPKAVKASPTALKKKVLYNPITQESTLKGGALALADKGICLINDIDQMDEENSQTFHDATRLPKSKASPNYRCTIIAGATPIGGSYDSSKTFWENVVLKDDIVSAFDVLCVVKDDGEKIVKKVYDMVDLVTDSDEESCTSDYKRQKFQEEISHDLLKNYITYARSIVFPSYTIPKNYDTESRENVPLPKKQLHSLERLAEAHARMHLRKKVIREDLLAALHVLSVSLISSQRLGAQESLKSSLRSLNDYLLFANALL